MGFITKYGTVWGSIPATGGRVFWVSPADAYTVDGRTYSASDNHDGLSPERALRTLNHCLDNLVTANAGDVIVCLPGTHTPQNSAGTATSLAMDTAGVTLMGLPSGKGNFIFPKATIAAVTGDQCANVTAADIEIAHLRWIPVTADSAIDLTAAADRLYIHDCSFDMATPAANTGTIGIDAIGGASNVLVENCYFECDGAQGDAIVATATLDSVIQNCTFMLSTGTWASVVLVGAATDRLLIRDCDFMVSAGTMTAGINGTGATIASGASIMRCYFSSSTTVSIDNFSAGEADVAENYVAGVGATDGGVLITAIT